jgi:hypothetical protein
MNKVIEIWDALRIAVNTRTKYVAEIIRYSMNVVYRWQEPQGGLNSGTRSPYQVVVEIFHACIELGTSRVDALAPLDWIERSVGRIAFDIPNVEDGPASVVASFIEVTDQLGDVARAVNKGLAPKSPGGMNLTADERRKIRKEVEDVRRACAALDHVIANLPEVK